LPYGTKRIGTFVPNERRNNMVANRAQFFKVAGLLLEVMENPTIKTTEAYISKVLDVVDEVEEVNDIADRLNQAFYQYTIDAQQREKQDGI